MNAQRVQRGFSTANSIELSGAAGLSQLGASVEAQDVAEFAVRGTRWSLGRATISELTLTSFQHDRSVGIPLGFPQPGSMSVVLVLEGLAEVVVDDETFLFIAGSAAVQPAHAAPRVLCRRPTRLLAVTLDAKGSEFAEMLPEKLAPISASVVRTHPAAPFFQALAHTMHTHPIRIEPTATILTRLVAGLLTADQVWHTRPDRPTLSTILDFISDHHLDPSFDRRTLARASKTSPRALDDLLREQTGGKGAEELITERRLISAVPLLRPGSGPDVEHIAARCGFPSQEAFEAIVERVYGVNASALLTLNQPQPQPQAPAQLPSPAQPQAPAQVQSPAQPQPQPQIQP